MAFDPDAYLAAIKKPSAGFNPDTYLAENKIAAPTSEWTDQSKLPPDPRSAGSGWLNTALQGAKGVVGGMNVPLWNAVGSIPVPALQKFAAKEANVAGSMGSPTGQALGQGTTQALSMLAQPELAGGKLAQVGGQAALSGLQSYLTAPQGQKARAGLIGAGAGGLLSGAGAVAGKALGGSPETASIRRAIQDAQAQGYKLMPSEAVGFGKASQELINAGKGTAAAKNYSLYESKLGQLAGVPKGVPIDSDSLAHANKSISDEFASKLVGKTVDIPSATANAVRSLVERQPAIAEEVVGATGLSKAFEDAAHGEPLAAKDWFAIVRQLKSMRYAQKEPNVKMQLTSVIDALEQPVKQLSPDINKAYQKFNSQYRANALLLNTVSGDVRFLQTGKINPVRVWASVMDDAKSAGAQAKTFLSKDQLTHTARLATQLNLVPQAREEGDNQILNAITAGMHAAGLPVHLSMSSANVIPKLASATGIGKVGRAIYGSPMGQQLLESGQVVDPNTGKLISAGTRSLISTLPK